MKQTLFKEGDRVIVDAPDIYSLKKHYGKEGILLEIIEVDYGWKARVQLRDALVSCDAEQLKVIPKWSLLCVCVRVCPFRKSRAAPDKGVKVNKVAS